MYKILLIICLFSLQAVAQTTLPSELDSPRKRADRLTQEMMLKVGIQGEQIPVVDSLNFIYAVQMQEEIFDADLGVWSQYWKGSEIMEEKDLDLKKVLSPSQFEKYQDLKSEVMWQIVGRIF